MAASMSKWEKNNLGHSLYGMFGKETAEETDGAPLESFADSDWPSLESAPQSTASAHSDEYTQPQSEQCTYFAPGTIIEGTLHSINDVEIAGDFSGEIVSEGAVTIHANTISSIAAKSLHLIGSTLTGTVAVDGNVTLDDFSTVTGNIRANTLDSAGTIKGNLNVRDSVALRHRAQVTGDIKTALLSIDRGVKLIGKVDMS